MNEQPIDLRESLAILRRRWLAIVLVAALGAGGGAFYAVRHYPQSQASAQILLPAETASGIATTAEDTKTQVILATSSSVLTPAAASISPPISVDQLAREVTASAASTIVLGIEARAANPGRAVQLVAAVAQAYQKYVKNHNAVAGATTVIQPAEAVTPPSKTGLIAKDAILGLLTGVLVGIVLCLVRARRNRRLRRRDQIAGAIGAPVLASMDAGKYKSVAHWMRLFEHFDPSTMNAWTLRSVLRTLVPADLDYQLSIDVVSLVGDNSALATGPELALFAAASGIPTQLAPSDHPALEPLSAACAALRASQIPDGLLTFRTQRDEDLNDGPMSASPHLVVTVRTVDPSHPDLEATGGVTILAVSSGFALIDDLARVELASAKVGVGIDGIVVVNPDPTDSTTGSVPEPKPVAPRSPGSSGPLGAGTPTRLTGRSRWRA